MRLVMYDLSIGFRALTSDKAIKINWLAGAQIRSANR